MNSRLGFSRLVLGTWPMGGLDWGDVDESTSLATIQAAINAGTNTIDTAPAYGFGDAERLVGRAIAGRRERVVLASKGGLVWNGEEGSQPWRRVDQHGRKIVTRKNGRPDSLQRQCEESLRRLRTDYLDLYQLHWPDPATPIEATMEGLLRLREQGKIRAIGFCNIDCELLRRALRVGRVDTIQAAYSLLNREIEGELIPLCRDHGVAVWAYWAMERGLLSGSTPSRGTLLRNDHRRWDYRFSRSSRRRVREAFEKAGQDEDFAAWPPARLALAWALHAPGVEAVLVGATSPQEVRANGGALDVPLSEEQRQRLAACFASCAQALARPSLEKQGFKVVGWALAKIAMWRAP